MLVYLGQENPRLTDESAEAMFDRQSTLHVVEKDLKAVKGALELYRLSNFEYPTMEQGLKALVEKPVIEPIPPNWNTGGYLMSEAKDPWGRDYVYRLSAGNEASVCSYGKDGAVGGEGDDADIGVCGL